MPPIDFTPTKQYLGDSIYAQFDGYHIILTTENGLPTDPSNRIALEPGLPERIIEYQQWALEWMQSQHRRRIVKQIEKEMACNCDLDKWEPERLTGHSHVCQIHNEALKRFKEGSLPS